MICQSLEDDIGMPERSGLRNQLKIDYDSLIAEQRAHIYANEAKMTPDEKWTEIEKLPQLVTAERETLQSVSSLVH